MSEALRGEDVEVDVAAIERSLSELWRVEGEEGQGVTKAALWNVVAHTDNDRDRAFASETLSKASASVPQRTMIIRAARSEEPQINSWISANCHILGEGKQVCSEEIVIVAGGHRVDFIPPLVHALILPELPVATWWIGDLPTEEEAYLASLLDPVDHLIVDSSQFDSVSDLQFLSRCGTETHTTPSDLNWSRLEHWRVAAASMFDAEPILARSRIIRRLRIRYAQEQSATFGARSEAILFAAWLFRRLGYGVSEQGLVEGAAGNVAILLEPEVGPRAAELGRVVIEFNDGTTVQLGVDMEAQAIRSEVSGLANPITTVTRLQNRTVASLVVRQLARTGVDRAYGEVLPAAIRIAQELVR